MQAPPSPSFSINWRAWVNQIIAWLRSALRAVIRGVQFQGNTQRCDVYFTANRRSGVCHIVNFNFWIEWR